ncbi:ABC-type multidrug transport system permease subunit [Thermocatellispora tengchongensis]|uniref:Transport permease protein n=1 Tax=Thermocatellispora tengchongensis TaxID=1073253 RepID=A0A840PL80_9ACTN|nr:ABC transporter permease [Thermocatellispora tengchongensis]MBB5138551.1 ABC-type multidrug transport system permease subunit [Thermocatellispora tengchongensis]
MNTVGSRLGWAVRDGWTITRRDLTHLANQPWQLVVSLLFPIMMVLMFGYLLGGAMTVPGGGDYREFLLPGMFGLTMVFGLERTLIAISTDASKGVTDRFRSMPMSGSAVVLGRCAADLLDSVVVLAILAGCGLLMGWDWHRGLDQAALAFGLLLWLRFAMLWVGIYLGLMLPGPEMVMAAQILVWPFGFLSSTFASPDTMPGWLGAVVEWNPLSATVSAARELFGNPGVGGDSWAAANALPLALAWPLLLTAIFFPLSVRRYRRLSR